MFAGFVTKSGSMYKFDEQRRVFVGGRYTTPTPYMRVEAMCGAPALIYLHNGAIIRTNTVERYLSYV